VWRKRTIARQIAVRRVVERQARRIRAAHPQIPQMQRTQTRIVAPRIREWRGGRPALSTRAISGRPAAIASTLPNAEADRHRGINSPQSWRGIRRRVAAQTIAMSGRPLFGSQASSLRPTRSNRRRRSRCPPRGRTRSGARAPRSDREKSPVPLTGAQNRARAPTPVTRRADGARFSQRRRFAAPQQMIELS